MIILSIIKLWVYESNRTHEDCKGNSGYAMSIDKGAIVGFYKKQKLNTKRFIETEIVGVDDAQIFKKIWQQCALK